LGEITRRIPVTLDPELLLQVARDVHSRKFGEELVLLDLTRGEYFSLDELGARIWEELAAGHRIGEVVERLAPQYDVERERFQVDLLALVEELLTRGLLVLG
jgi:hypothetical protein